MLEKKDVVQKSFRIDKKLDVALAKLSEILNRSQNELIDHAIRLLIRENEKWFADKFVNEYFEKNSLTFTPDMELATTDMILPAVRHNLGLGFIPAEFADSELKSGQVFEIKVKEKLPERNIILIYDMEYPQSIAAKEFQKFLKEKEM